MRKGSGRVVQWADMARVEDFTAEGVFPVK